MTRGPFGRLLKSLYDFGDMTPHNVTHARRRRWSSDHPHGNGQRARGPRIVETGQGRPGLGTSEETNTHPARCALDALDRRAGGTGAVGTAPQSGWSP